MVKTAFDSGILLVNKPKDLSSFAVVKWARKLLGLKKVGHLGTLDPFATGVLPLVFGRATRLSRYLLEEDKKYQLKLVLGTATDTMDSEGQITESAPLTKEQIDLLLAEDQKLIRTAVQQLTGVRQQKPPPFSAVKIKGRPMYLYARAGEMIEAKARKIEIYEAKYLGAELDYPDLVQGSSSLALDIFIHCSKGSYMRVLADELGRTLGSFAYAAELKRLQVGAFELEQTIDLAEAERLFLADCQKDSLKWRELLFDLGFILSPAQAVAGYLSVELDFEQALKIAAGQAISTSELAGPAQKGKDKTKDLCPDYADPIALFYQGNLLAMATVFAGGQLKAQTVFYDRAELIN